MPKLAVWSWGFVGVVAAAVIVAVALAAVSEIVLPMTFAAVLAVIFKPLARTLQRHRWKPSLAAGVVVLCLLAVLGGVVVATVRGVTEQADQISAVTDKALNNAADQTDAAGAGKAALDDARTATESAAPMIANGFLTKVISGVGSLIGLVSGIILGALIMYYLLKDGTSLRRRLVARIRDPGLRGDVDDFIGDTCRILRDYGRGRTIMSAIVAVVIGLAALLLVFTIIVVNFVGGYIPYIGAFLGGGLAVIVALGDGGLAKREASSRRSPVVPNRPCNACSTDVYPSITTAQDTLHSSVACASISRSSLVAPGDSLGFPRIDAGCSLADPAAARQLSGWHKPTTNLRE
jgi:predicted PurR-regulated permease PerM